MNPLKRARAFLGLTPLQMASDLGISLRTYQRREALAEEALPYEIELDALKLEVEGVEVLFNYLGGVGDVTL